MMCIGIKNPFRSARAVGCSLVLFLAAGAAHAQFYAVTDLGTLGGTNGMAYGINNQEQIVGAMQTPMGSFHGFLFDGGRVVDLGTMGGSNSWAYGINDNGWMVGGAEMPWTNMHAFLCTNALMNPSLVDLGTLGGTNSAAWMLDHHGDMVGWAATADGAHHAFFMTNWAPGGMMDLGTAGGTNSEAVCINSNRMVVGYATMSSGNREPIMSTNALYGSSSMMTMGMGGMSSATGGQSWFVNDLGDTVGQAQMSGGNYHAFVSGSGGMMGQKTVDLGTLGGTNSAAYCLNNARTVVGTAQMPNGMMHAFVVTNALGSMPGMTDLNRLIPTNSGWELMVARGMNAAGQIIGWGMHAGHTNAFLLTPASTPVMMISAPVAQIVGAGARVTLQLQMSTGEPLTYQWRHDGSPIAGATDATFKLPGMSLASAGQYTVTARNAVGTVANCSVPVSLFAMQLTNGTPCLTVAAPAGTHFQIDYADMLVSGPNWQPVTNFTMMGSVSQVRDPAAPGAHARFYRAVIVPSP